MADTPETVALALVKIIVDCSSELSGHRSQKDILKLYADCLRVLRAGGLDRTLPRIIDRVH